MTSGRVELAFAALKHIQLLLDRAPSLFNADYRYFFCRFNDPGEGGVERGAGVLVGYISGKEQN